MKRLIFTVTNELSYDQRMARICHSLNGSAYSVMLVGTRFSSTPPLAQASYEQIRLHCFFRKGKLFYIEFNIRLFFFLLFQKADLICAIDLDTILSCFLASKLKGTKRVYDAHELFCEMKEIVSRPAIYATWKKLEKFMVPRFPHGYTVNEIIADEFRKMYGVDYKVIRNMTLLKPLAIPVKLERYIIYQGAVNEGRCFETLIPAMVQVPARLIICGDGNFMHQAQQLTENYDLKDKVIFKGKVPPADLYQFTLNAWIGVTLFDKLGLSNYYSLANRFFDYIHAGLPQLCVDYPVYHSLNAQHEVAVLTDAEAPDQIALKLNRLLTDDSLYARLQKNCLLARESWNWQKEELTLKAFYSKLFT